jgi:hypothetical protein
MLLQVRELSEFPLADFTAVRFDAQMNPCVLREIARVGKRFCALRALVWLSFTHVLLMLQLMLRFSSKNLKQEKTSL